MVKKVFCTSCHSPMIESSESLRIKDWRGMNVSIPSVKSYKCEQCGHVTFTIETIIQEKIKHALSFIDLPYALTPYLLFLHAGSRKSRASPVLGRVTFHKELWYLKQRLGDEFQWVMKYEGFRPAPMGPYAVHFDRRIGKLLKNSVIRVDVEPTKYDKPIYKYYQLEKGYNITKYLWKTLPSSVIQGTIAVKKELNNMPTSQLVNKVHLDYPNMWLHRSKR